MHAAENQFISGLDLSEAFYREAVAPIIKESFPSLVHSAALIGSGSEVLGFDTQMSTDHDWGPRVILFVDERDAVEFHAKVRQVLREKLPRQFRGYPTGFVASVTDDDQKPGTQPLDYESQGPVNHRVSMTSIRDFVLGYLNFDICNPIAPRDWLTFPEQKLLAITSGRVFHDEVGLSTLRHQLSYFPHDVWLYLMASAWTRIEQEGHLMGRAGSVGDELGASLLASRLVRDIMRLSFLMEKCYAPYPKWFGTAFKKLKSAPLLQPILQKVVAADEWTVRETFLVEAYQLIAVCHNQLEITEPMPTDAALFHDRPYRVISTGEFSGALVSRISDPEVKAIAKRPLIGSIDLFSDSTDLVADSSWRSALIGLYD